MSETDLLAEALVAMAQTEPVDAHGEPVLAEVEAIVDPRTGTLTGVRRVTVSFPAGRQNCRWSGGFLAEVMTAKPGTSLVGVPVLVAYSPGGPIVVCTIYPRTGN